MRFLMAEFCKMTLFPFPWTLSAPCLLHPVLPPWVSWWRTGTCLWQVRIKGTKSNPLFLKASKKLSWIIKLLRHGPFIFFDSRLPFLWFNLCEQGATRWAGWAAFQLNTPLQ